MICFLSVELEFSFHRPDPHNLDIELPKISIGLSYLDIGLSDLGKLQKISIFERCLPPNPKHR